MIKDNFKIELIVTDGIPSVKFYSLKNKTWAKNDDVDFRRMRSTINRYMLLSERHRVLKNKE